MYLSEEQMVIVRMALRVAIAQDNEGPHIFSAPEYKVAHELKKRLDYEKSKLDTDWWGSTD